MKRSVERLCARLAAAPAEVLGVVDPAQAGAVRVQAVVADLFRDRATRALEPDEIAAFRPGSDLRHPAVVLVACWLLHDESFAGSPADALRVLLATRLAELAALVPARAFVEDPDRREELVRVVLQALGARPEGETVAASEDRLAALDSVRRDRLLRDARAREAEREKRRKELEILRAQEEEARRQAARTTFED